MGIDDEAKYIVVLRRSGSKEGLWMCTGNLMTEFEAVDCSNQAFLEGSDTMIAIVVSKQVRDFDSR